MPVAHVLVENGRATGVALANGDEIRASLVLSNADPRRTFLELVGEKHLPGEFVEGIRRFRFRGASANPTTSASGRCCRWQTIGRPVKTRPN